MILIPIRGRRTAESVNKEEKSLQIKTSSFTKAIVEKNVAITPMQVNKRMRSKMERGIIRPEATLDLHGYSKIQAKSLWDFIEQFVYPSSTFV